MRPGYVLRFATPIKVVVQRFAYMLLVVSAVGVILLGKADSVVVDRARVAVVDALAPILDALSRPAATISVVIDNAMELAELRAENAQLREANERLAQWQLVARELEAENRSFRDLLNFVPGGVAKQVSARVIADTGGAYVRSALINVGADDHVGKGQAVITGQGLVGRVTDVGDRSARVLLVTDLNSRIPVLVESSRYRAILAGDNSNTPKLAYLPTEAKVSAGDRIVTSGHGGIFPKGLPVGIVTQVADGEIRVRPFVDLDRLAYVRVIDRADGASAVDSRR